MRTFKKNIWKLTSLLFLLGIFFVGYSYLKEYQKNSSYRKDIEIIENFVKRTKEENLEIKRNFLSNQDPLSQEKERKDKFGEALKGEKMIFISKQVLDSIILPFLINKD
jgi:hypothetical protein